jgi:hypothetical protein
MYYTLYDMYYTNEQETACFGLQVPKERPAPELPSHWYRTNP